jgi:hypothetical protein
MERQNEIKAASGRDRPESAIQPESDQQHGKGSHTQSRRQALAETDLIADNKASKKKRSHDEPNIEDYECSAPNSSTQIPHSSVDLRLGSF